MYTFSIIPDICLDGQRDSRARVWYSSDNSYYIISNLRLILPQLQTYQSKNCYRDERMVCSNIAALRNIVRERFFQRLRNIDTNHMFVGQNMSVRTYVHTLFVSLLVCVRYLRMCQVPYQGVSGLFPDYPETLRSVSYGMVACRGMNSIPQELNMSKTLIL